MLNKLALHLIAALMPSVALASMQDVGARIPALDDQVQIGSTFEFYRQEGVLIRPDSKADNWQTIWINCACNNGGGDGAGSDGSGSGGVELPRNTTPPKGGKTTDTRRVGTPNGSTLDRGAPGDSRTHATPKGAPDQFGTPFAPKGEKGKTKVAPKG